MKLIELHKVCEFEIFPNGIQIPFCRGIVTADVLVQGLSRGAITTRKLKAVKRDKEHEDYTGSAPYGEGKSLLQLRLDYLGFR